MKQDGRKRHLSRVTSCNKSSLPIESQISHHPQMGVWKLQQTHNTDVALMCLDSSGCQARSVKGSNVAVVSWWLAQISRKRAKTATDGKEGNEKAGGSERKRAIVTEARHRHHTPEDMGILSLSFSHSMSSFPPSLCG